MNFKFKDKTAEEITDSIIIENNFNKSLDNLKNVVLLMNFEKRDIMNQKVKKYLIPNIFHNIKETYQYNKKIKAVVDKTITSFHISKAEFIKGLKSGKY